MSEQLTVILMDHYRRHGDLVPRKLWMEARPPDAPLHDRFEWDNERAGDEYRDVQAAALIRCCKKEYTPPGAVERKFVRSFVSTRFDPEAAGYRPIEEVAGDEVGSRILIRELERELGDLKRRYGHLVEFVEVVRRELYIA